MAKKKLTKRERQLRQIKRDLERQKERQSKFDANNPAIRELNKEEMEKFNKTKTLNVRLFDWERTSKKSDDIMEELVLDKVCKEENFTGDLTWIRVGGSKTTALLVSFDAHNNWELRAMQQKLVNNKVICRNEPKRFAIAAEHSGTKNVFVKTYSDFGRIGLI